MRRIWATAYCRSRGPGSPFWDTNPVDALKALGNVGIPRGEFWLGNPRNLFLVKEIASAAHIYGKPYVDAESWTTWRRWRDGPFTLKNWWTEHFVKVLTVLPIMDLPIHR